MKFMPKGVCAPEGFLAGGIACGIKGEGIRDIALVMVEDEACPAAAVFTTNKIKAHPVKISKERIKSGMARAVFINSGNANCCTGPDGYKGAMQVSKKLADLLFEEQQNILLASTGIIGKPYPTQMILKGLPELVENTDTIGHTSAAMAIMTTDSFTKESAIMINTSKGRITIGGMAKGAGMIHPNMATMLAVLTTDAQISSAMLSSCLKKAVDASFNKISVDGDMSTNDSVFILANGRGIRVKKTDDTLKRFQEGLTAICMRLAEMIVRDGEGATRFVRITVEGASTPDNAKKTAEKIATSPLFKCSMFGAKLNWGRIAAAAGSVCPDADESKIEIIVNRETVFKKGVPLGTKKSKMILEKEVNVIVRLNKGKHTYSMMTCDLSPDYVLINKE